ncbi:MAG TPA: cytochrome C, partial [Oxalobacteraceae bacterium]|nr:cytochrome C [Oxalobacteraceae bacterium]
MSSAFTKSTARNIFYGGAVFFFFLFLALTFDTMTALPKRDNRANLSASVVRGKNIW